MTTCTLPVKRKISVPKAVYEAVRFLPASGVSRGLAKFPVALTVVPIPTKPDWIEVTIEDTGNLLGKHTDHQLRNLLMLAYLKNPPEFCYRNFVAGLYPDARWEVPNAAGFIDVMTDREVIEVKIAPAWKHALGQVLAYSHVTGKVPVVALFGDIPFIAREVCLSYGVSIIEL